MIDRREFVRGISAAVAATTLAPESAHAQATAKAEAEAARQIARTTDSSPFRIGIIGPGSRGKELVRNFLRVPGVKIVAAADIYQPRFAELNAVCGYEVPSYSDFRKVLDRKDLNAVIVSTPLGLHASHVIPALESGHHVYGEKAMAYHLDDARRIVEAVKANKRIFQVGHQYRYSPWIRAAVARVQQGEIGDVTHIMAYWNRNNNWRRPVPDPSLERLINWRLYNEWSLGLFAELGSHHMDIANWVFGSTPTSAIASGSSSSAERLRCTNKPQAARTTPTATSRLAAYGSCAGSSCRALKVATRPSIARATTTTTKNLERNLRARVGALISASRTTSSS